MVNNSNYDIISYETKMGYRLTLDEQNEKIEIQTPTNQRIVLDRGYRISLEVNGSKIELNGNSNIKIDSNSLFLNGNIYLNGNTSKTLDERIQDLERRVANGNS